MRNKFIKNLNSTITAEMDFEDKESFNKFVLAQKLMKENSHNKN